ncbi:MAG TPA: hypothetical protein VF699_11115 [Caulobacteraceae bacterium]|jgi:hypothetical protein
MTDIGGDATPAYDRPLKSLTNGPVVVLWGDQGVSIGLTPEAALATADALRDCAEEAMRNRDQGQSPA